MFDDNPRDAIELLKSDHRLVESLFDQLEATDEDSAKVELAQRICTELSIHAKVEEEIFYPASRDALDEEGDDLVDEATVEHRSLKQLIAEIDGSSPSDDLFDANLKVLKEYTQHHVREEEQELMPKVKRGGADLDALGERIMRRKKALQAIAEKAGSRGGRRAGRSVQVPPLTAARKKSAAKKAGGRSSGDTGGSRSRATSKRASTRTRSAASRSATPRKAASRKSSTARKNPTARSKRSAATARRRSRRT
jgi:hemerythrin superfamily protein